MMRLPDSPETRLALSAVAGGAAIVLWKAMPAIALAVGAMFGGFGPGGGGLPGGAAGGDLGGSYPNPTVLNVTHVTTGTLGAGNGGTGNTNGVTGSTCAFSSANLAGATRFASIYFPNASTLLSQSNMTHDSAGAGTGTFVTKLCSDGATCGGGNVYLTCTAGANCATAAAGQNDACTLTKSAVPAGTTLTWSVGTACGTTDPAISVCEAHTTP